MSIFRLEWACMVVYYVQEVGKRCILVGYYFPGAVVAGFLKNFVYACMDIIRLSQLVTGCVTCHTSHGCVTHFRPILGNLVEVTLVTSPFMYIVSHANVTSFP